MQKTYISGPMTGIKNYNFPAFDRAQKALENLGYHVFSPASMDRLFEPNVHAAFEESASVRRRLARRDVHILLNEMKAENGDFVTLLDGHEHSIGSTAEKSLAMWFLIPIFTLREVLDGAAEGLKGKKEISDVQGATEVLP